MFDLDKTKPATLSAQLANALRSAILRGEFLPEQPIPSEREIGEAHGISRTTVRAAIGMLVDEGVLYRQPGSGTYVSGHFNSHASLATLGLIVPTLANPYFGELSDAIEHIANERSYQILVGQSDYTATNEASYLIRYADNFNVKGVIVVPNIEQLSTNAYHVLKEHNKPFVFAARWPDEIEADGVSTDHKRGAFQIVSYLLSLGHTRIAYIEGIPHQPDARLRGYQAALKAAGIENDPELIVLSDHLAEEAGLAGVRWLLSRHIAFSAIFARNDLTASGVLRGLYEANLHIPDDVSVVGFDSTKLSAHFQPPLTTVDHTLQEIGRQAVHLLLDRIESRYDGPARHITIEPRLVIRESCRQIID